MFGNDVTLGDFNADGRLDVVASSPGLTGGTSTGTATLFFNVMDMLEDYRKVVLRNHQTEGIANFGHDLAVCDWNSDRCDDLCVGAIWNTNSRGVEGGGLGPGSPRRETIAEEQHPEDQGELGREHRNRDRGREGGEQSQLGTLQPHAVTLRRGPNPRRWLLPRA